MSTEATTSSVRQPPWHQPEGQGKVMVFNSLTRSKVPLVPSSGNTLKWYICGPTVYDASHLGHARTYLSFDIMRRILKDYFKYNIRFVMNITDIDDKIIIRSREQNIPFTELSRKWEAAFMEDMKALKVLPPDVLTRVSEYVPEIISFVAKIIENGYAYTANGSVYFDTAAFRQKHNYAKLEPWAAGDAKLMAEGEGSLSVGQADKKSASDFALWKKSKEGEPSWDSPFGPGRPGWHIECSAMASDILGSTLDIHTGGEDLRFPHHDNELAQSEAYFKNDQWVNYFIHSGHLHISGCKMSKSLKNFITIQEALQSYTARQIRFFFLLHKYEATMDYSAKGLAHAIEVEKTFTEFFHTVKAILRSSDDKSNQRWGDAEKKLADDLDQAKKEVHEGLVDNFNTPEAMLALGDLVRKSNIYLTHKKENSDIPRTYLLSTIADYITEMFKVFGLIDQHEIGFPAVSSEANVEQILTPFLNTITKFREDVRTAARAKEIGNVLSACDKLRDETLPLLGVRLDDLTDGGSIWKLGDKEELAKEVEQKKKAEQAKLEAKLEAQRREQEKLEKAKIPPSDWFKAMKDKYSEFDNSGFPTKDAEGKEITKSALKNLKKEYDAQAKAHQKYLDSLSKSNSNNNAKSS